MADTAKSRSKAIRRLRKRDPKLKSINLNYNYYVDKKLTKLVDCLLKNPNVVTEVSLRLNYLTDETGVKLARYVANSSTIKTLDLSDNKFGDATCLAMASALRINTSLENLYLYFNREIDYQRTNCINAAFIAAIRINPIRASNSRWWFDPPLLEYYYLKQKANKKGHPSMQALLATKVFGVLI